MNVNAQLPTPSALTRRKQSDIHRIIRLKSRSTQNGKKLTFISFGNRNPMDIAGHYNGRANRVRLAKVY